MDWLTPAASFAQLLNILLIPLVLFAHKVLKHMTVVEAFMVQSKKDTDEVKGVVKEHDRALAKGGFLAS